jgi:hypothetical protein
VLANVHKRTIVKSDSEVHGGVLRIAHCNNCVIYIVANCRCGRAAACRGPTRVLTHAGRYALLSNCINCIVLVGTVQHVLFVDRCERTRIIATARSLRINACKECVLNICVNSVPPCLSLLLCGPDRRLTTPPQPTIASGTNHELVLGPYNSHYPKLETHLVQAGLNPLLNRWDQFVVAWPPPLAHPVADEGARTGVGPSASADGVARVPRDQAAGAGPVHAVCGSVHHARHHCGAFALTFRPAVGSALTARCRQTNPCKLPPPFADALKAKQHAIVDLRDQLLRLKADDATQRDVQTVVEGQFKVRTATGEKERDRPADVVVGAGMAGHVGQHASDLRPAASAQRLVSARKLKRGGL